MPRLSTNGALTGFYCRLDIQRKVQILAVLFRVFRCRGLRRSVKVGVFL